MRALLIVICLLGTYSFGRAHNYFFGFAEMQYNKTSKKLETTIILSAHDLEDLLIKEKKISKSLEYLTKDEATIRLLQEEVIKDFVVKADGQAIRFESIGFEVKKNGLLQVYFQSQEIEEPKNDVEIRFSCLMDAFPKQQNKITYLHGKEKLTEVFLPAKLEAVIKLNN